MFKVICEIVKSDSFAEQFAKSVIVVGNILIPLVNCYHHWNSTTLNLFISELLITSEIVEY